MKRIDWKTVLPIAIGAAVLLVPPVVVMTMSDSVFREECKQRCETNGMDYKVRATGLKGDDLYYPAECTCIPHAPKRWWEFWR